MSSYSATEALFKAHRDSVDQIQERVKKFHEHNTPFRVFHGNVNTTRPTSFSRSSIVDISKLDHVLYLDPDTKTCLVQPNVDMWTLVNATLEEDMLPPVVPEYPGITVGGAFNGTCGESSSWKHGFFDRSVVYIQVILADGRIVHCGRDGAVKVPPLVFSDNSNKDSPDVNKENAEKLLEMGGGAAHELSNKELRELFYASIGSMGTLGVTTMFCLSLESVAEGSYVLLNYQPVSSATEAVEMIQDKIKEVSSGAFEKSGNSDEAPSYIDGILFDAEHGVVMTGRIVAPGDVKRLQWHDKIWVKNFVRPYNKWFYLHAKERMKKTQRKIHHKRVAIPGADLIPIRQYLFRYDVSGFWMGKEAMALLRWPYNRLTRMITYPFIGTQTLVGSMHLSGAAGKFIIQDIIMPADDPKEIAKLKNKSTASLASKSMASLANREGSSEPKLTSKSLAGLAEKNEAEDELPKSKHGSDATDRTVVVPEPPQLNLPSASAIGVAIGTPDSLPGAQKPGPRPAQGTKEENALSYLTDCEDCQQEIAAGRQKSLTADTGAQKTGHAKGLPSVASESKNHVRESKKREIHPQSPRTQQLPKSEASKHTTSKPELTNPEATISQKIASNVNPAQNPRIDTSNSNPNPKLLKYSLPTPLISDSELSQGLGIDFTSGFSPGPTPTSATTTTTSTTSSSSSDDEDDLAAAAAAASSTRAVPRTSHREPSEPVSPDDENHAPPPHSTKKVNITAPAPHRPSDVTLTDNNNPYTNPTAGKDPNIPTDPFATDPAALQMLTWLHSNLEIYPLWLCPIAGRSQAPMHQHAPILSTREPRMLLNIGVRGPPHTQKLNRLFPNDPNRGYDPSNAESRAKWIADNRAIELKTQELGGKKWLYGQTFYADEGKLFKGVGLDWGRWEGEGGIRERFGARGLPGLWEKIGHKEQVEGVQAVRRIWGLMAIFGFTGLLTWA